MTICRGRGGNENGAGFAIAWEVFCVMLTGRCWAYSDTVEKTDGNDGVTPPSSLRVRF